VVEELTPTRFPANVEKWSTWGVYKYKQLEIIKQCVECKKNYDNGCPFLDGGRPLKCQFFIQLKKEE